MSKFDKQCFDTCMSRCDMYCCAGNFWWQNPFIDPAPVVTIPSKNTNAVAALSYPTHPADMVKGIQHEVTIVVPPPGFDPLAHAGALTRVSPCEYVFAAIEACGQVHMM